MVKIKSRSFKDSEEYNSFTEKYYLLPFKFHRLNKNTELLVSEVGDFIMCPTGTYLDIVQRNINKEAHSDLYKDLISKFIISEEPISLMIDNIANRYRTKKVFLNSFTALHIFVISLRCEHTCSYCQVSRVTKNKEKYDMSFLHIDKGIEFMMKSPNQYVTMEFQGGEALLAFDEIKYGVKKAQEEALIYGKEVKYVICTNLSLVNKEMLSFCKDNNVLMSSSLDGPKFIHDENRNKPGESSYELAVKGIALCREIIEDNVSALMTTSDLSLEYPIEIVDEYRKQGFSGIFLRNISPYGFALRTTKNRYSTDKFLEFYKVALNYIIELNKKGEFFVESFSQILLTKMLTPFSPGYVDMQSPSGILTGAIVFNYNGEVYCSDESRMLAEEKDFTFRIGHLDTDTYDNIFYSNNSRQILNKWGVNESLAGCSECALQQFCGTDPVLHWATQGDAYGYRPTSSFCNKNMEIIRYLFELMDTDLDVKRIFESWIRI